MTLPSLLFNHKFYHISSTCHILKIPNPNFNFLFNIRPTTFAISARLLSVESRNIRRRCRFASQVRSRYPNTPLESTSFHHEQLVNGLLLPFRLRMPVQRGDNREGIALTRHPPPGISRFRIFTPDSPFSLIMTARWPFGFFAPLIVTRSSPPSPLSLEHAPPG